MTRRPSTLHFFFSPEILFLSILYIFFLIIYVGFVIIFGDFFILFSLNSGFIMQISIFAYIISPPPPQKKKLTISSTLNIIIHQELGH